MNINLYYFRDPEEDTFDRLHYVLVRNKGLMVHNFYREHCTSQLTIFLAIILHMHIKTGQEKEITQRKL